MIKEVRGRYPLKDTVVDDASLTGSIQIYHMQTPDAVTLEHLGHLQRIFVVNLLGRVISLRQPDAFAIYYIYSGISSIISLKSFSI